MTDSVKNLVLIETSVGIEPVYWIEASKGQPEHDADFIGEQQAQFTARPSPVDDGLNLFFATVSPARLILTSDASAVQTF